MFEVLAAIEKDPILEVLAAYREDNNPNKIDLGVGVYKNEAGITPIMESVSRAEALFLDAEDTKAYVGPAGETGFNRAMTTLLLGEPLAALLGERLHTVQTPGGCGALRLGGELVNRCKEGATLWVSDPTWVNHIPLFGNAGLNLKPYAYYDADSKGVNFDAMIEGLKKVPAGDAVLLHGCCHNPTGADLSEDQWIAVAELAEKNGFLPFIDIAYQGFGEGLDEDAFGVRLFAERVPELIVASSCSKNFGLYRERVGALSVLSHTVAQAEISVGQVLSLSRGNYSMPPSHGAAIVSTIFAQQALTRLWETELAEMRERMNSLRALLVTQLQAKGAGQGFNHIQSQKGMFSFLGLTPGQVQRIRDEHGVYMTSSSRINVAGISQGNIDYLTDAIVSVL